MQNKWTGSQLAILVVIVAAVLGLVGALAVMLWPSSAAPSVAIELPANPLAPTCLQQAQPFVDQAEPLAREWDDAVKLADSTPRASLPPQISTLQGLRRKVQDLEAPECAFLVKQRLLDTMDNTINGFIAFLGQRPDGEVKQYFDQASKAMADYTKEIRALANK